MIELLNSYGAFALLCSGSTPDSAVVFVHGFGGKAASTWQLFPLLARAEAALDNTDLFFYGYQSTRYLVETATVHLRQFISKSVLSNERATHYCRMLAVGHSLGAVLVRQLIKDVSEIDDAERRRIRRLLNCSPLLFAPAHGGFKHDDKISILKAALPKSLQLAIAAYEAVRAKAYDDLRKGSIVLSNLQNVTERFSDDQPTTAAFRANVVWGAEEEIVFMTKYRRDRRLADPYEGHDHTTVCKPNSSFPAPMEHLINELATAPT